MLANQSLGKPHTWSPGARLHRAAPGKQRACRQAAVSAGSSGLVAARRSRLRQLPALTTDRSAQPQQSPTDDPVRHQRYTRVLLGIIMSCSGNPMLSQSAHRVPLMLLTRAVARRRCRLAAAGTAWSCGSRWAWCSKRTVTAQYTWCGLQCQSAAQRGPNASCRTVVREHPVSNFSMVANDIPQGTAPRTAHLWLPRVARHSESRIWTRCSSVYCRWTIIRLPEQCSVRQFCHSVCWRQMSIPSRCMAERAGVALAQAEIQPEGNAERAGVISKV